MTDAAEQLRKVLALDRRRKFADTAVVGGLDGYLLNFADTVNIAPAHKFVKILKRGEEYLYDLREDPGAPKNMIGTADHEKEADRLLNLLVKWRQATK